MTAQSPVVQMYTTTICAYCIRAKMLLGKRHIAYQEINIGGDHDKRAWLVQVTGRKTVPQIFIHGRSIGGFEELAALDRAGQLMPMVQGNASGSPP